MTLWTKFKHLSQEKHKEKIYIMKPIELNLPTIHADTIQSCWWQQKPIQWALVSQATQNLDTNSTKRRKTKTWTSKKRNRNDLECYTTTFCLIFCTAMGSFLNRISYDIKITSCKGLGLSSTFPAKNMHTVAINCQNTCTNKKDCI